MPKDFLWESDAKALKSPGQLASRRLAPRMGKHSPERQRVASNVVGTMQSNDSISKHKVIVGVLHHAKNGG